MKNQDLKLNQIFYQANIYKHVLNSSHDCNHLSNQLYHINQHKPLLHIYIILLFALLKNHHHIIFPPLKYCSIIILFFLKH